MEELAAVNLYREHRYVRLSLPPVSEDAGYCERVEKSVMKAVRGASPWAGRSSRDGSRPWSYFTVKQNSLFHSVKEPLIKVSRLSRVLALLVLDARRMVMEARASHLPMWQLHSGSAEWFERIGTTAGWWGLLEFVVADCFLNTPCEAVIAAVEFWLVES